MGMPTFLTPHKYINYIDEYLDLVLNKYGIIRPNYFCTYYKFDYDNSILDDRPYVDSGSYNKIGPELSGKKWKRIDLMPVWLTESEGPIQNMMNEEGIIRDIRTSFIIPDYMGVRPTAGDFMYVYNNVSNKYDEHAPLLEVIGREDSYAGKRKIYKVNVKNSHERFEDLEKNANVSSYWIYVNFFRTIFEECRGRHLLEVLAMSYDFFKSLKNDKALMYDVNINMFVAKEKDEEENGQS